MKILVIGGGIFGCSIAQELSEHGINTTLIDESDHLMDGASKCNHNRLHLGFHYPRSKETALQSIDGLLSFSMAFKSAIHTDFPNYYAIAKGGYVNAEQFKDFCDDVGLFYTEEYPNEDLMSRDVIEGCLRVKEPVLDYHEVERLVNEGLTKEISNGNLEVKTRTPFDPSMIDEYDYAINATYSNLNGVASHFSDKKLKLKLQDVVIPIVKYEHDAFGLTVMDGPFCSVMPHGFKQNKFLVYHVTESVLEQKIGEPIEGKSEIDLHHIVNKSAEIYPFLKDVEIIDYYRTIRALPINDDDSRLSEIFLYEDNPKLISVLSGKISTCKKVAMEVYKYITTEELKTNIIS